MTILRTAFSLFFLAAGLVGPLSEGLAASSDWAVNEGGRMRLILLPADPAGTREGALVIEPQPGWVTYWKEPGDVGIPPSLTPAPGASYAVSRIDFPPPKLLDAGGMRDVGYDQPVVLPLTLSGSAGDDPVTLSAFIGVCRNICIPFQAELTVASSAGETEIEAEKALITTARAALPEAPSPGFSAQHHMLQPDLKRLDVTLSLPPSSVPPRFFLTGPSGYVFVEGTFSTAADGQTLLSVPIRKLPKKYTPSGKQWGLLVMSGDRAMETTLAFD